MDWIVIDGVKPYDGRYEFDFGDDTFTIREWGWIRRFADYRPLTFGEGIVNGDAELFGVLAAIALHRAGRIDTGDVDTFYGRLLDSRLGPNITVELGDQEPQETGGADPPPPGSSNGSSSSSGDGSTTSSETSPRSPDDQKPAGTPDSDSSASDRPSLVS